MGDPLIHQEETREVLEHGEEEEEEEEALGEDVEEPAGDGDLGEDQPHLGHPLPEFLCLRVSKTLINPDSKHPEWAPHLPRSQVQIGFVEPLKEGLQRESVSSMIDRHPQYETISEVRVVQTMESEHSQDVNSLRFNSDSVQTMESENSLDVNSLWFNSDFVKDLNVDPRGNFHRDFEILQLDNESTFPPLYLSERMISKLQKIQEKSDPKTNHSTKVEQPNLNTRNGPAKKVRPHSLSLQTPEGNSGPPSAQANLP